MKEDCIARLITSGYKLELEEETELATNPLIRHIAPHLQVIIAQYQQDAIVLKWKYFM